ncbi:MAG: hypothetical protein JO209_02580 [Acidisphaera sp.]|nr:hypothetical protein [Acidisphaera sp.]
MSRHAASGEASPEGDATRHPARHPETLMRGIAPPALAAVLAMLLGAAPVLAQAPATLNRSTSAGHEVEVGHYSSIHRQDCSMAGYPQITITRQPRSGSVSIRPGDYPLDQHIGPGEYGDTGCLGVMVHGLIVYYTPESGFRGQDSFAFTVTFRNGSADRTAVIAVH